MIQFVLTLLKVLFVKGSFGIIQFYESPDDIMPEKDKNGFMALQFILAFAATSWLFVLLSDVFDLENRFGESHWQRIVFVICLGFIVYYLLGLIIEGFLFLTSKTYRKWRTGKEE